MRTNALALMLLGLAGCATTDDSPLAHRPPKPVDSGWVEVRSPHFIIDTEQSPARAADAIRRFELNRAVLLRAAFNRTGLPDEPMQVVAFRDEHELEPFCNAPINEFEMERDGHAMSVTSSVGAAQEWEVRYLLMLHFMSRVNPQLPPWLQSGLSDLLASMGFRDTEAKAVLGVPSPVGSRAAIERLLVATDDDIAVADDRDQLRNGAYLFALYLFEQRGPELAEFQQRMERGEAWRDAWVECFRDLELGVPRHIEDILAPVFFESMSYRREFPYPELPNFEVATRPLTEAEVHAINAEVYASAPTTRPREAQNELARSEAKEALAVDARDPISLSVLHKVGDTSVGPREARAAAEAHPNDARAWMLVAALPTDKAAQCAAFAKAASLDANDARAQLGASRCALASEQPATALAPAERAAILEPWNAEVVFNLALAQRAHGDACNAAQTATAARQRVRANEAALANEIAQHLLEFETRCAGPDAPKMP